jgi:hypothetical protein
MEQMTMIEFVDLDTADLRVGAICSTGPSNSWGDEPIHHLLPVDNMGGFRSRGERRVPGVEVLALVSNLKSDHWPDTFRDEGRQLLYYGDNEKPEQDLHATNKSGNQILRDLFHAVHGGRRKEIPPIFVFTKTGQRRDVRFEGMAVPGGRGLTEHDDLVAFWTSTAAGRFLNYRAMFTMLPEKTISASFLASIRASKPDYDVAPPSWVRWREVGWAALDGQPPISRPWMEAKA